MKLLPIAPTTDLFVLPAIARAIRTTLRDVAEDAQRDLAKTVASWERQVTFAITTIPEGFLVTTDDEVWGFVDKGTRPHVIVPRNKKVLFFGPGAQAKTRPRVIASGSGSKGGAKVVAHRVNHPGTEAREFSATLQERYDRELGQRIDAALAGVL